jgi:hypothetical protein
VGRGRKRTGRTDLLARPPCVGEGTANWIVRVNDPAEQLEALVDLRRRGLLTAEEFEWQKAKVLAS